MARKLITKSGEIKWEVVGRLNGRGSKQMKRRFDTRADAEAFELELCNQKHGLRNLAPTSRSFDETTFKAESEHWLNVHKDQLSPSYLYRVQGILDELWPTYGNFAPDKFQPSLLSAIRAEFLRCGLKAATANRKLNVITSVLNFSVEEGRIPFNPSSKFKQLKEVRDDLQHWEKEEALSFLSFANQKYHTSSPRRWVYAVYLLALNAAPRAGEIWGLKPKDIIENGELIFIQRQLDLLERRFRPTKGKENRRIPCNKELLGELRRLITTAQIPPDSTIFRATNGSPCCHNNFIHRFFRPDMREWGGKQIRFHDLRHSAITLMIASGLDLKTVQEIAGHKDIKTTMNYVHLLAERIKYAGKIFSVVPSTNIESPRDPQRPHLRLVQSK